MSLHKIRNERAVPPNAVFSVMDVFSPPLQNPVDNSFKSKKCEVAKYEIWIH